MNSNSASPRGFTLAKTFTKYDGVSGFISKEYSKLLVWNNYWFDSARMAQ
jgi:hypothetical protein